MEVFTCILSSVISLRHFSWSIIKQNNAYIVIIHNYYIIKYSVMDYTKVIKYKRERKI